MIAVGQVRYNGFISGGKAEIVGCTGQLWWVLVMGYPYAQAFTSEEVLAYWWVAP